MITMIIRMAKNVPMSSPSPFLEQKRSHDEDDAEGGHESHVSGEHPAVMLRFQADAEKPNDQNGQCPGAPDAETLPHIPV